MLATKTVKAQKRESKSAPNVLLLENIHESAEELFYKKGYRVRTLPHSPEISALAHEMHDIDVLGIRSKTPVTRELLQRAPRLCAIGAFCIGVNHIDLEACQDLGVAVFNAPYSNTRSVVELALGEMIMLFRGAFDKSVHLHNGVWDKSSNGCFEMRGKKLGIIGYGKIGSQLSVLAENMGMEVYYYDIVDKLSLGNAKKCRSLPELLKKVDVLSVNVDGRLENKNLIGVREFRAMKNGAYVLNLSRGFVIDINALADFLKAGKIRGAALDVFPQEPKSNAEKFQIALQHMPNVILTPHIGGSTEEAQQNIAQYVPSRIIEYLAYGNTIMSVNFPHLQISPLMRGHRLAHIHKNLPGLLACINSVLAKRMINITGQYLKTNERIGYVITDINKKHDSALMRDLQAIQHTIKVRILY